MKKIVSIVIGLVLMLTLVSCQNEKKAVENDVKETMGALQKGNFSVLKIDKQTEDVFKAFEGAYKKMSYKINNTTEKNKDKIQKVYDIGLNTGLKEIDNLLKYLNK